MSSSNRGSRLLTFRLIPSLMSEDDDDLGSVQSLDSRTRDALMNYGKIGKGGNTVQHILKYAVSDAYLSRIERRGDEWYVELAGKDFTGKDIEEAEEYINENGPDTWMEGDIFVDEKQELHLHAEDFRIVVNYR